MTCTYSMGCLSCYNCFKVVVNMFNFIIFQLYINMVTQRKLHEFLLTVTKYDFLCRIFSSIYFQIFQLSSMTFCFWKCLLFSSIYCKKNLVYFEYSDWNLFCFNIYKIWTLCFAMQEDAQMCAMCTTQNVQTMKPCTYN
jgi:hypothetical protein